MRNKDGYYIMNAKKWEYYENNPKDYRKGKIIAYLWLILLPIAGIPMCVYYFEEMGLSPLA